MIKGLKGYLTKAITKSINTLWVTTFLVGCLMGQQVQAGQGLKIMIPLYSYPNWYNRENYIWPEVAAASKQVPIVAVINPNNGPGGGPPNRDYARGIDDLRQGNVTILGYVATTYGDRPLAEVKTDIDLYARHYNIDGIFIDEAASSSDKLDYYQEIYRYIKAKPNLDLVVLNQGTQTDEGYLSRPAGDVAIIFENYSTAWPEYESRPYMNNYPGDRFSCLIHTTPDIATMKSHIEQAVQRHIGYIYITDDSPDSGDRDPWNSLPSYWREQVNYIQSINDSLSSQIN